MVWPQLIAAIRKLRPTARATVNSAPPTPVASSPAAAVPTATACGPLACPLLLPAPPLAEPCHVLKPASMRLMSTGRSSPHTTPNAIHAMAMSNLRGRDSRGERGGGVSTRHEIGCTKRRRGGNCFVATSPRRSHPRATARNRAHTRTHTHHTHTHKCAKTRTVACALPRARAAGTGAAVFVPAATRLGTPYARRQRRLPRQVAAGPTAPTRLAVPPCSPAACTTRM